jgi:DNA polymerase-3 subunit alpha
MRHAELHVHDHFSVLDGASTPLEYMKRAKEIGITHLAQTNHGTNMGHREWKRQAEKAGIVPILGQEAYITDDRFDRRSKANRQDGTSVYNHITLLAQNEVGLKNLEHLSRVAWTEGFYFKPRMDIDLLEEHNEGIIALSGCMSGMIAKAITEERTERVDHLAERFKSIFNDRFFIEVMESNSIELNQGLVRVAEKNGIKTVVTSDCHMASKADLYLAESMLVLNTAPRRINDVDHAKAEGMQFLERLNYLYPERKMTFTEFELWLHTYEEHRVNLEKHGIGVEALDNTMVVAEMIESYPYFEKLDLLPQFCENPTQVLREKVQAGLRRRNMYTPENIERCKMELGVIEAKGLESYFLIEEDVVNHANENNILVGYGRGSAVSYLTNYALGITKINPMPYDLLPERFLSVDREDPADIDTDFAIDGRYKIKDYVGRKYGHVSNIATVGYYKDKSALKAACKVLGVPYGEANRAFLLIDTLDDYVRSDTTKLFRQKYPSVLRLAKALVGRVQNVGMHAGGTVISKVPIEQYVPVQSAKDPHDEAADRVPVAALDMNELADIGFIKYDFLGLRTLSIVDDCMKMIKDRHGVDIDIENIPLDDKNIYDMISAGHTSGLFQAEASASTKTILQMGGVHNFAELVASNALVRPGAANSTVGATYMDGKRTGNITYIHQDTKRFTEETFSAILYQEQQLLLCQEIAGMSKADANKVRKAVSKKIPEDLAIWKDEFITGAAQKIGHAKAEKVWKDLEASADYAFAKAHAVGYSMLTLLTAYLKYYYPIEFITAAIDRMNSSNKADRMKMLIYLIEAKRLGLRVKLPHVNASGVGLAIESDDKGDFIRFGLSQVKYLSDKTALKLMDKAPFKNYQHLLDVAGEKFSGINTRTLGAMNKVGAAAFPDNPRTGTENENYYTYLNIPSISYDLPPYIKMQFRDLVDFVDDETFFILGMAQEVKTKETWQRVDFLDESGVAGVFVPLGSEFEVGKLYAAMVANNSLVWYTPFEKIQESELWPVLTTDTYPDVPEGMWKVIAFNKRKTKKGEYMANVTFADGNKNLFTALAWPSSFAMVYTKCKVGEVVDPKFVELRNGGGYSIENIL